MCNIYFSLAYGGKVLLHNTHLFLHRGKKYGLLGHNGAGKTTLLRNIANGKIEGMPKVQNARAYDSVGAKQPDEKLRMLFYIYIEKR